MPRYQIREAFVSLGDDFDISDAAGRPVYHVDGKVLTINDRATITDMRGTEVASLHRKLVAIRSVWVIERDGHESKVRKDLINIVADHFVLETPEGDFDIRGNILHHDYRITDRGGKHVAEISKRWIALTDTYGVEIADGYDDVLILAAAIAIDAIYARAHDLHEVAEAAGRVQSRAG